MAENNPKVKGILYGTHQRYLQQDIDPDMLYWITDKGLLIRGDTIVTPTKFIDITPPSSGNGSYTFTIEAYEADPTSPTQYSFEVYTKAAVNTLIDGLQTAINSHVNKTATDQVLGHVKLSDATDDLTHDAATGGMAATPKAVASVRSEGPVTDFEWPLRSLDATPGTWTFHVRPANPERADALYGLGFSYSLNDGKR